MDTFASRLKYFRQQAKLNQKELANKAGVSFAAYNKYETKGQEPKIEILIKLANALGIDVNTLIGFDSHNQERLLSILQYADIIFKRDANNDNYVFIELSNSVSPIHVSFSDLSNAIEKTQTKINRLATPFFKEMFFSSLISVIMKSPPDNENAPVYTNNYTFLLSEHEKGNLNKKTEPPSDET